MTNRCIALSNLNVISIESSAFAMAERVFQLSERPWQHLMFLFKSPLHWLCNWDLILNLSTPPAPPLSDWQGTDWGCHKSWRQNSPESPWGGRFQADASLIQWGYPHTGVCFQSSSPLISPFSNSTGPFTLPSYKTLLFWSNLPQFNFSH